MSGDPTGYRFPPRLAYHDSSLIVHRLTKVGKSCKDRGNARIKGERKCQDSESDEKQAFILYFAL